MVYKENRNKNSSDFSYSQLLTKLKEIEKQTYNIKKDLEKLNNIKKDIEKVKNMFKLSIVLLIVLILLISLSSFLIVNIKP